MIPVRFLFKFTVESREFVADVEIGGCALNLTAGANHGVFGVAPSVFHEIASHRRDALDGFKVNVIHEVESIAKRAEGKAEFLDMLRGFAFTTSPHFEGIWYASTGNNPAATLSTVFRDSEFLSVPRLTP